MDEITRKHDSAEFEPDAESIIQLDLVSWTEAFSCGIKIIDDQHKGIINLINEIFNHVSKNENEEHEFSKKVIEQAKHYVEVHFKTEEQLMLLANVPGYKEHKKAHESFKEYIALNARNFEEGNNLPLSEFTGYLKGWVLSHIAVMDKEYFECFKKSFPEQFQY